MPKERIIQFKMKKNRVGQELSEAQLLSAGRA